MTGPITVLDCTLRDGGYYTNWQFARDVVNRYLRGTAEAGVDIIEVGFRTARAGDFLGPYAHTTDWLLESLDIPECRIGVMLNASDLVGAEVQTIDALFRPASESPVSIVRIATHLKEVPACVTASNRLQELGYEVGVNLMQTSLHPMEAVRAAATTLQASPAIGVLYFADSLGDMDAGDVRAIVGQLSEVWDGPLGIHTHDNRRHALANSMAAIDAGVEWVDSTIRGMGRGAGNAQTEFLLAELSRTHGLKYTVEPLVQTVMGDFAELQREHGWGADMLYLKAAEYGIHPTYIQLLQQDPRYDLPDMVTAIQSLRQAGGSSFSTKTLADAVEAGDQHPQGGWDPHGWLQDREVVVLAASPSTDEHAAAIERVVRDRSLAVLCLNAIPPIDPSLITAYVACHPVRVALEAGQIARLDHPIVIPQALLDAVGIDLSDDVELLDYGIVVEPGRFEVGERSCTVPSRLALAYALAVCVRAGAQRIILAGLDGYASGDPRQEQVQGVLDLYTASDGHPPMIAITPTTYHVDRSSVYAAQW